VLACHPDCLNALKEPGIDALIWANNHAMDHGGEGLANSLESCASRGIAVLGAGNNREAAARPLLREINGVRLGIFAMAEGESPAATNLAWGVNPISHRDFARQMGEHRSRLDYAAVIIHGGVEHYPYPTLGMIETAQFFIEQGADLVVYQHTHCPGCIQDYGGGTIVYGQGNLIFDGSGWRTKKTWNEGFLLEIDIVKGSPAKIRSIPYLQSVDRPGLQAMNALQEGEFRKALERRNEQIKSSLFVEESWKSQCAKQEAAYFSVLRGHGLAVYRLNKMLHFARRLYSRQKMAVIRNVVRCESHREAFLTMLEELLNK
jgi:poly-gamma-glutamate synthesis protein (capsule biosynthesis protein)